MKLDTTKIKINKVWTNIAPASLASTNLEKVKGAFVVLTEGVYGWEVFSSGRDEDEMFALHELLMATTNAPKMSALARLDVKSFGPGIMPDEFFPSERR